MKFLAPGQANDELFYSEAERTVKADNTFSFAGRRYEAPRDVRSRVVLVRHDPLEADAPLIVYLGAAVVNGSSARAHRGAVEPASRRPPACAHRPARDTRH